MCKKPFFLLLFAFSIQGQNINAQTLTGADAGKMIPGSQQVILDPNTQTPFFVEFAAGKGPAMAEFESWMKRNLKMNPSLGLTLINTEKDELGFEHFRYGQTYNGFPINQSMLIVHVKNRLVASFNGEFVTNLSAKTETSISESRALEMAKRSVGAKVYKWEIPGEEAFIKREQNDPKATFFPTGKKFLVKNKRAEYVLAWRFDVYAHQPVSRQYVFVEATSGEVLSSEDRIHESNAATTAITAFSGVKTIMTDYIGGKYRLRETIRGKGINTYNMKNAGVNFGAAVDFTNPTVVWNNVNANKDQYATDVHWGAETTYDYYQKVHKRNSIDGKGFALNNYVHANLVALGKVPTNSNAYWDGNRMVYGDGEVGFKPFTSLDITGHEITHGLTEKTANLGQYSESGALNEGFSDIFGTAIEFYGKDGNAGNWTIGEEVGPVPFRSLSNPKLYGDPDTYMGEYWFTGIDDNGGVHHNNGVLNRWFYLLSKGGSGKNDLGNSYKVVGIGMDKATAIAFRTLTKYLTPTSDYAKARQFSIQAAVDSFGACSPEVIATKNAWFAVGIGEGILPAVITGGGPLSVCVGTGVFLSATPGALSYQWKLNGVAIAGATFSSYPTFSSGSYTVSTTYCGASYTSLPALVTITTPFATIAPAGSVVACSGASVNLTATTTSGNKLQWNKNGVAISGATSASYAASTSGSYTVTSSGTNYPQLTFDNATEVTIPGNGQNQGCQGNYSDISISGVANSYLSSGISVKLLITTDDAEEVSVFLETPSGDILGLIKTTDKSHSYFYNTVFSDNGAPLYTGTGSFGGNYKPYAHIFSDCGTASTKTTFGSLGGNGRVNANGTWRLRVFNHSFGDVVLNNWQISFSAWSLPSPNCNPVTSAATTVNILAACRQVVNSGGGEEGSVSISNPDPAMEQNIPNPWNEHTHFSVFVPENTKDAEIRITSLDGRLHKVIPINGTGNQEVDLTKENLANGLYLYSLWTNQQPVAIKKMVLIR